MTNKQAKQKLRQIQHKQKGIWHQALNQPVHVKNPAPQTEVQKAQAKQSSKTAPSKYDIRKDIALQHCYLDRLTNEKVFTKKTEPVIKRLIVAELGADYLRANPLGYEYGELLNRFGL
jgi:hypothetical protein